MVEKKEQEQWIEEFETPWMSFGRVQIPALIYSPVNRKFFLSDQ
jgi:hypothetical protein